MATTNLVSKSLGMIRVESGNGTPNHVAPTGSTYVNIGDNIIFINEDGSSTGWAPLFPSQFTEVYIQDNATNISSTASTWSQLTALTWTIGSTNGNVASTNGIITIQTGRQGRYSILGSGSFTYVATNTAYDLGISINGADPNSGAYSMGSVASTRPSACCISPRTSVNLNVGDTIRLMVRPSANGNILFKHGGIIIIEQPAI
jgi:hypothetical protein